jgi:hypothetical protein
MGQISEKNRFYQEREKAALEYAGGHQAIRNAVGARGFTIMPGYYDEALTDLELKVKRDLSAANLAILSEAIERELKQTGHDYDITIKNARVAWEIEKQGLLADLANELADHKKNLADSEDELDRRAVEIALRESLLITAKTEINLELEGLKQQLQETDRLTWNKELALINAQKLTAQAKLAVIPILEQIIEEEAKILAEEEINIGYTQTLADARQALIGQKEGLIPLIFEKAGKQIDLAASIRTETDLKETRLELAKDKAALAEDRTDLQVDLIAADIELEDLRKEILEAKNGLRAKEDTRKKNLVIRNQMWIAELSAAERNALMQLLDKESDAAFQIRDKKQSIFNNDLEAESDSVGIDVDADLDSISSIASTRASERKEVANISATAKITSQLTHLLAG